jgi:iron complex outermembrane recepter protein
MAERIRPVGHSERAEGWSSSGTALRRERFHAPPPEGLIPIDLVGIAEYVLAKVAVAPSTTFRRAGPARPAVPSMFGSSFVRHLVLAAAMLAASGPRAGAQNSATARLAGRVTDRAGLPVRSATITATVAGDALRQTRTRDDGLYELVLPAPASVVLRIRALGYAPASRTVSVDSAGAPLTVDVLLDPTATALTETVITATRSAVSIAAIPGAVTALTREQIEEQTKTVPRLGPLLAQLVPGLGAATENLSNFGQNIRGRAILVLIDGVPQSTSRNVSRDFINIDPAMVERVEVVRGATSVYGNGATGGVINVITRRGEPGPLQLATDVSMEASLSHLDAEALGPRIAQRVSGTRRNVDFVASGAFARAGALFDAEGDRIPPDPTGQGGFAETNSYDLFGKAGYAFGPGERQRLELSANLFAARQATEHASDFSINSLPAYQQKSSALPGLELERGQGTTNRMLNAEYVNTALLGSRVQAQAYGRTYNTIFRPFDDRRYTTTPQGRQYTGGYVMQTYVESSKHGGRLQIETPLARRFGASVLWGTDYTSETTSQPVYIYDSTAFNLSNGVVFDKTGDGVFVPPLDLKTLGLFAQFSVSPFQRLVLRGGARHERASVQVDDFTALNGVSITGGVLRFRPVLYNAGAVVTLTDAVNLFANYSQGFSLADIGLVIRAPAAGITLGSREANPQQVDQYETGIRGSWRALQASATVFRNSSDLGTSVGANLQVVRAPERVRGVELTLDVQPVRRVAIGGTYTWTEGDFWTRVGTDSAWQPLNTFRIQPPKTTAYVQHQTTDRWKSRLQVLHSGSRNRAYEAFLQRPGINPAAPAFGERPVDAYTIVDLLTTVETGRGELSLGVRNLLDTQYFPIVSQLMPVGNVSYSAAPGATLSVGYSVRY